jgi:tetratricopeptide (TPR) repeat protein
MILAVPALAFQEATKQSTSRNPNDAERQEAIRLYHAGKMPEAAAIFEKLIQQDPKDIVAHELLGAALVSRAQTQSDPEKRKADRLRARAELLRAQELGDTSDLCKTLLGIIPEDGHSFQFSQNPQADAAMQVGETTFAKGDWEGAIKAYSRALDLDPRIYSAAQFIGDCYYHLKQADKAAEWFGKSVQIEPNNESAYRYWGDALLQAGDVRSARTKYIEGVAANPYQHPSWNGLHNWVAKTHRDLKSIPITIPQGPKMDEKGNANITIDPTATDPGTGGAAWLMYPMERVLWKNESFAKEFPQESVYRHSLKEEVAALSLVVTSFDEQRKGGKLKKPDPSLVFLSQIKAKGLLEPFILLVHADAGIAQDYSAYRDAHREKLIQFLNEYVVPPAP